MMLDEPRTPEADSEPPEPTGDDNRAPTDTHRESQYLRQLVQNQTPVTVYLQTGEVLDGFIEYYDRRFLRLTREDGPNLFIFKKNIKYLAEKPASKKRG